MVDSTSKTYDFYVLYTADGYFYGGYSDDAIRRFHVHESGKGAKFTRVKSRHPLQLIYYVTYDNKHDAMHAEATFKALSRHEKEAFLAAHGVPGSVWKTN
ncbi:GIY-YIG nuclease family protein [Fructobacillus sp. M1-13]|uniref:GIY-YIG nuclease family protein n=1 Tax=Fructobacillus papyriferae TaxID=2713171 RepID=A0ABS5QNQ3_9LACO|nr:GIY-YIG nuclease family protein [Fructobacillus papyriferae]MBS9334758.1 GIY-YIG nuclease family protein [Fructobacillus papyriferae]MCD2158748.1 GIY-YIG nuclease family protein [Fructobacillus papyriferae]